MSIDYCTPLDALPKKKNLDRFRGCLVGGAAGDALGYTVEFLPESILFRQYGTKGITAYQLRSGLARFSDDTQMTLFTANGLLAAAANCAEGKSVPYVDGIAKAYREWFQTQSDSGFSNRGRPFTWLMNVPGMYAVRAPGNTCMTAIAEGCCGTMEKPINNSKGCGGVMRVSPIGLCFGESDMTPLAVDRMGAEAAALTHGHGMGYIPAAMLVHIIRLLAHNERISLKDAVLDSKLAMEKLFPDAECLPTFLRLIDRAIALAEGGTLPLRAIHTLGQGWCGDEALAVAIYCALKYSGDFDKAVRAAVNHGGDSDSTGAITGNILGAYLGLSRIPAKYTEKLELLDVILEIADDLYALGDSAPKSAAWAEKYVDATYAGKRA